MKRVENGKNILIVLAILLVAGLVYWSSSEEKQREIATNQSIAINAASLAENATAIADVRDILKERSPNDVYSLVDARLTVLESKIQMLLMASADDRWKRASMIDYMNEVQRLNPELKIPEIKASGK